MISLVSLISLYLSKRLQIYCLALQNERGNEKAGTVRGPDDTLYTYLKPAKSRLTTKLSYHVHRSAKALSGLRI